MITPVSHIVNSDKLLFALYQKSDVVATASFCATEDESDDDFFLGNTISTTICDNVTGGLEAACPGWDDNHSDGIPSNNWDCDPSIRTTAAEPYLMEMGIVADYEFFVEHGGTPSLVESEIQFIIASANSDIFSPILRTALIINTVIVYGVDAESDPYEVGSIQPMWDELRNDWVSNPETTCARYDVVQLFTGKSSIGAAGYVKPIGVGAICDALTGFNPPFRPNPPHSFGVSQHNNSALPNYTVVAHEIIHNLGQESHTDALASTCSNDLCESSSIFSYFMCEVFDPHNDGTPALAGQE